DRKVKLEDLESGVFDGTKPINFDDNREWNRAILEGQTNPPTLNSEIKYRKRAVLENSFVINMSPFFKNAEPYDHAKAIRIFNDNDSIEVPIDLLPYLFFQFARDGKRLYEDNFVDSFVYIPEQGYSYEFKYVTHIEVIYMIKVQCIICDTEVFIDQNTLEAKRLRNDPMHTFMCDECKSRLDTPKQR